MNRGISQKGLTLTELLLVMGLIVLFAALTIPAGISLYQRQLVEDQTDILMSNLKRAQMNAVQGKNDSSWGVYFQDDRYFLFSGDNYEERDPVFTETFRARGGVNIFMDKEEYNGVLFEKTTGEIRFID